jgi:hypothetical protein
MRFTQRSLIIGLFALIVVCLQLTSSTFGQSPLSDWEGKWEGVMTSTSFHQETITVKVTMEIKAITDHEWKWLTIYEENKAKQWPQVEKNYRMIWVDSTKTPFHLVEEDGFTIFFSRFENQLLGTFLIDREEGSDVFQGTYTLFNEQELWFTLSGFTLPTNKTVMGEMEPNFFQKTILKKQKN